MQTYLVYFSLLLALIVNLLFGWYSSATGYPDFVLLVLFFWAIRQRCGVGMAWIIGVLIDVLHGGVLGQHALSYTAAIALITLGLQRLRLNTQLEETLHILLLLIVEQSVFWLSKIMVGEQLLDYAYFLPSLTGAGLWFLLSLFGVRANQHHA